MSNSNLIGKKLANRYEIVELIGLGGMAAVYRGRCELLKRDVAIKILKEEFRDDPAVLKSFRSEAQAAAGLSDSNIVSVYDVGQEDGLDYMVMELVQGQTLKKYIKEKKQLQWREACDFAIQICNALSVAHAGGIIHRDIKPQNVIVTNDKILKVTDFGIAKAASSETVTINTNDAMGSVHYISPEQARGGFTDARSDIYSLGIVMYEMLAGRVPYDSTSTVAIALMHIEQEAEPLRSLNSEIPQVLAGVVMKTMSKEPHMRYQSAAELAADITAVLEDKELPSAAEESSDDMDGATRVIDTKKIDELASENKEEKLVEDDFEDDFDDIFDADEDDVESKAKEEKGIQKETQTKTIVRESKETKPKKKGGHTKTEDEKKADVRATWLALLTVAVIIGSVVGGYFAMMKSSGSVRIPDLTNSTTEYASEQLAGMNIEVVEARREYNDELEEGRIISQYPAEGWSNNCEQVRVVISKGPSGGEHPVPDISGMDINEAQAAILEANMVCEFIEDTAAASEDGSILITGQSPQAGTKIKNLDERSEEDGEDLYTVYVVINGTKKQLVEKMSGGAVLPGEDDGEDKKEDNSGERKITLHVPTDADSSGIFKVIADGETLMEEERTAGEDVEVTVKGDGEVEVVAYFDDEECFKQTYNIQ